MSTKCDHESAKKYANAVIANYELESFENVNFARHYIDLLKQHGELCAALEWYAGESKTKETAHWENDVKFLTFDKFGGLCEDLAGPHVARETLARIGSLE